MNSHEHLPENGYDTDIVVIGSGPAGLAFCRSMVHSTLHITLIDPNSVQALSQPQKDGREVSIIRKTEELLHRLGAWQHIPEEEKFPLKAAKVINGESPFSLDFAPPNNERALLGYFVPNYRIRQALFTTIQEQENITTKFKQRVTNIHTDSNGATVILDDGSSLRCKLVVSADSRYSQLRKTMGIATQIRDFGRSVVIFRMQHTRSNELTALECFHYGRTMAVLPLGEYQSSIVITIDSSRVSEVEQLSSEATEKDVMEQLNGRLGNMTLASSKHCYPLVGVHAERFYAKRYALIGDTAVGMHPVTAQGFNLGMQSQEILSSLIISAEQSGDDIGSASLLQRYHRQHKLITAPLYHGTNAIVKLFTDDTALAKPLRHLVLRAGNYCAPFKYLVNKRLSGS